MQKRKVIALVLSLATALGPMPAAHASGAVAGATEFTQLANNFELVTSVAQQAQQLATELQQYQTMVQNLVNIPNQIWSPIQQDLVALQNIVNVGQALSFASNNVVTQFQNTYSGFTQATKFSTAYKNWSKTTMDSIKGSLAAANLQANQFSTEEGTLSALRSMSQSSGGQLQALQTGTQIAVEQVSQLQKLRGLMMAQMQAQNAYMAGNQQDKDNRKAAEENFFVPSSGTNGKSYKFF